MRLRKPELIPLIFTIGAVTLLSGLGVWQVERLQWKKQVLAQTEQAQALPALGTLPADINGLDYRKVALTGTFLNDKHFLLVGHPQDAPAGFFIETPFRLDDDGRIILVNRGFSPEHAESQPQGVQTVQGIVRPARQKRMFSPGNRPDRNIWFYEDLPAMSAKSGLELTPLIVEATGPHEKDVWPMPNDGKVVMRNDHLQYAITWFALAIIAVIMFIAYHRVPEKKEQP